MLKSVAIPIADIYVPADRRKEFDPDKVDAAAEKIMDTTDEHPIQVRKGKGRFVLVKGVHRLEAAKALGEETIRAIVVGAVRH